jgi:hypothetical protein
VQDFAIEPFIDRFQAVLEVRGWKCGKELLLEIATPEMRSWLISSSGRLTPVDESSFDASKHSGLGYIRFSPEALRLFAQDNDNLQTLAAVGGVESSCSSDVAVEFSSIALEARELMHSQSSTSFSR